MAIFPDFIDRYSCHFGKGAFEGCTKLKRVKIAVCDISEGLFRNCSLLENIEIIDKVDGWSGLGHKIRKYAFYGCSSLKRIVIPSYFRMIEESAFEGCTQLEYITKEEDKDNSLQKAFESFGAQLKKEVEKEEYYLSNPRNIEGLSNKENKALDNSIRLTKEKSLNIFRAVQYLTEYSYLYQVHIRSKAFKGCNIKHIFLDEIGLDGEENFAHCNSLDAVCLRYTHHSLLKVLCGIPLYSDDKSIEMDFNRTFEECNSLKAAFIGFHKDHIGYKYVKTGKNMLLQPIRSCFETKFYEKLRNSKNSSCTSIAAQDSFTQPFIEEIKKVEISKNSFSTLGSVYPVFTQTFKGCGNLVSVTIGAGILQDNTFADCIKLGHLNLNFSPFNVFKGSYIFKNCRKISNFYGVIRAMHKFENPDWTSPINETIFAESNLKVELRKHKQYESLESFLYFIYAI